MYDEVAHHETSVKKGGYRVTGYLLRDTSLGLIGTAKKKDSYYRVFKMDWGHFKELYSVDSFLVPGIFSPPF